MGLKPSKRRFPYKTEFNSTKKSSPKAKKIQALARPRTGRKTYPHSVSLTLEQIAWLNQSPNASELLRKLIDSIRELHEEVEPKLSMLSMKHELDILQEQIDKVEKERHEFLWNNFDLGTTPYTPVTRKQLIGEKWTFTEAKPEEVAFIQKKLKVYDEALEVLRTKFNELKDKFMES